VSHRLRTFLNDNPNLRHLKSRAKYIDTLQQQYQIIAPRSLLQASRVMQLHDKTLILSADNGAVAAKLRQISTELTALFQTMGSEVTGIQIRVQVRASSAPAIPHRRILGNYGRNELEKLSLSLPDSPLKTALKRLVKHKSQ
jgi:hypothetical protein